MTDPLESIDCLIINGTVLTMDADRRVIPNGAVAVQGSRIVAVGNTQTLEKLYRPRETIQASGMLVIPGLINTHTHSGDALFRGLVEDLSLEDWLQRLWVAEAKFLNPETANWGAKLAYIEMVRGGITTAVDMCFFPEVLAKAAKEVGLRLVTGMVYFDANMFDGIEIRLRDAAARRFLNEHIGEELIIPCVQPHSVYTVSPDYLQQAGRLAQEFNALFTIHASETESEVDNCLHKYGGTPIQLLERLGLLTPRTLLAHCVHLKDDEIDLLSARGAAVAHCPVSNLKLASGIARVGRMLQAGVTVTLGTDGPVSGNDLNLWNNMRLAAILQKTAEKDASLMPTAQIVSMATRDAARALGLEEKIGSVEVGKRADLVLIRTDRPHATPHFDPYSLLVYSIGREDVDTVLINGRMILRQGTLVTVDEKEVLSAVSTLSAQIREFTSQQPSSGRP